MIRQLCFAVLVLAAGSQAGAATPESVLDAAVADGRVAGVVAMVASADEVLLSHAAGVRDASGTAMTTDTVFNIASMTKAVTSVAVMQLAEAGKVSLDEPMSRYLDDFDLKPVLRDNNDGQAEYSDGRYAPTLRQLLSHTSGFVYSVWNKKLLAVTDLSTFTATSFMQEPLLFVPGSAWHYGTSTDWAGLIVERVSGQSLEEYFAESIFARIGTLDMAYNPGAEQLARRAEQYRRRADGGLEPIERPPFQASTHFSGGGGLHATAPDYIQFLQMILNRGRADTRVLSRESVEAMSRNQIGELQVVPMYTAMPDFSNDFEILPGQVNRFGLGFLINEDDVPGGRRAGSLAWAGLYNTYFWVDPETGICAVLMTQVLPFYDADVVELLAEFETAVYTSLSSP